MADDNALVPFDDGEDALDSHDHGAVAEWAPPSTPIERLDYGNNLEHVEYAFNAMSFWDKNEVATLRREWGRDAGANLAFAHAFAQNHTDIRDLVNREGMSDHPVIIRIAAMLGRRYAATPGDPGTIGPGAIRSGASMAGTGATGLDGQIRATRKAAREAAREGDIRRANHLAERERDLIGQRDGNEPIVGSAGRTA